MSVILYAFVVVAATVSHNTKLEVKHYEWRNMGTFETVLVDKHTESADACHRAAANLGLTKERYRCIFTRTGETR